MKQKKFQSLGKALASIAYDYNDILARIEGHVRLLAHHVDDDDPDVLEKENIRAILDATEHGVTLTRQLVRISQYPDDTIERCDVVDAIRQTQMLLSSVLGLGSDVVMDLPHQAIYVPYCEEGIVQVLMGCALDARSRHAGRMNLSVRVAGKFLRVQCTDNGIEGMTLGTDLSEEMFVVHEWVRLGSGSMDVEKDREKGCITTIRMPLAMQQENPFEQKTILVIDDGEGLSDDAERHLKEMGMIVLKAANADGALVLHDAYKGQIDLLLANAATPGLTGMYAAKELARDNPSMRVVFMTHGKDDHFEEAEVLHEALNEEIAFQKPLSMRKLSSTLERALRATEKMDGAHGSDKEV